MTVAQQARMLHDWIVDDVLAKVSSHHENPDRYAAAICIRVRPGCLLRGYSVGESWRLSVLRKA